MKLGEAVGILNACKHGGGTDWMITDAGTEGALVASDHAAENLTAFVAIAVAEKYKEGETPESVIDDMLDEVVR